jgi:hypothetical protein
MLVTVTNLSAVNSIYISSFSTSIPPSGSLQTRRTWAQVDADIGMKTQANAGSISIAFTEEAGDDLGGGGGLETGVATALILHKVFAAGAGGAADDVVIFAANAPYAFDIIDTTAKVVTAVGGSTLQLRDTAAGAGTTLSDALTSAATGTKRNTAQTTNPQVLRNGTLIIRRSDSGIAGSVDVTILRVS